MAHRREPDQGGVAAKARRPYAPRLPPGQRREQLLDAAIGVILAQGYSGISMEAVARAAGVTRPVVYDHFPNLGRLLYALVEREERYALEQLANVVPADPGDADPVEVLAAGVGRLLRAVEDRPATWRIILVPPEGTPDVVRQLIEKNRTRTLERIERLVRWAAASPAFPDDLDTELAAHAILVISEEAGRSVLTNPDRFSAERYERFAHTVMSLLWRRDAAASDPE